MRLFDKLKPCIVEIPITVNLIVKERREPKLRKTSYVVARVDVVFTVVCD